MKAFIVAIPLFDTKMSVDAYQLCARNGEKLFGAADDYRGIAEYFIAPGLDIVEELGVGPFAGDKPLFIDVNEYQLLMGKPADIETVEPERIVCILSHDISADDAVVARCRALREQGYLLAFSQMPTDVSTNRLMEFIDYMMLDFTDGQFSQQLKLMRNHYRSKKLVITNIPDMKSYDRVKVSTGAVLFTGSFYSRPITEGVKDLSPLKLNALRLLNQINEEDFDLTQTADTIEKDPSLSISLLRFINSSAVGINKRIDSIRGAVAILGQKEVKRWATVAISVQMAEDRPGEITRLSLVRARFAENLATVYEMGILAPSLFMAGLFSLLDIVLQKPMKEAMREVAVDDRVKKALVDKSGDLYAVMELIYAYERADWDSASINIIQNDVKIEEINKAFIDALAWYKQLLDMIEEEKLENA